MAVGIGNLGNIFEEFGESVKQIFGGSSNGLPPFKGGPQTAIFNSTISGGVADFDASRWTGNNNKERRLRYGFSVLNSNGIVNNELEGNPGEEFGPHNIFYLDIPPQSIVQKEIFANNISATRKGIIVETEGVIFKDIIISGTTGIFPGIRGGSSSPTSNLLKSPFEPPEPPTGVDPKTGRSRASNVGTLSGYEEFLRLRQFFLKYAKAKVERDGDLFLIFINEKDNQALIVEPLEFTMDRNSRSPLTYNYRIVLKAIGDLHTELTGKIIEDKRDGILGILSKGAEAFSNLMANISAGIQQARATINGARRLALQISQSIDQTFIDPLRQLQYAIQDTSEGVSATLSLPESLFNNFKNERGKVKDAFIEAITPTSPGNRLSIPDKPKPGVSPTSETSIQSTTATGESLTAASESSQQFLLNRDISDTLLNDKRVAIPRVFVESVRDEAKNLSDNLADFVNLGDTEYDNIKNRVSTVIPSETKVVSDSEFILMGSFNTTVDLLNQILASNSVFQASEDVYFENVARPFDELDLPEGQRFNIRKPDRIREVTILRGDTLERIAQRELGDVFKWVDIMVLNNLKPPYISDSGGDGILKPGDKILLGT